MPDIYDQHAKAFARVEAHVILKDGECVATIAFKFPADGAGRLWAYVHWIGLEMVRGYAGGYGYDKRTAACSAAAYKLPLGLDAKTGCEADPTHAYHDFRRALSMDGGNTWDRQLRDAGFTILQAV